MSTQPVRSLFLPFIGFFLPITLVLFAIPNLFSRWWLPAILALPVLAAYIHHQPSPRLGRLLLAAGLSAIVVVFAYRYIELMCQRTLDPCGFDIQVFWANARLAAQHSNFYVNGAVVKILRIDYPDLSPQLIAESIFAYPPQTMLFLLPLGWFNLSTAAVIIHGLNAVLMIATIILLWHLFLRDRGMIGLLIAAALLLIFGATYWVVYLGQTLFLLLFLLLLFWIDKDKPRAGLWLALATLCKPLVAPLVIYLIFKKNYRAMRVLVVTGFLLTAASIIVFGMETFTSFFVHNPIATLPEYIHTYDENLSILAVILRASSYDLSHYSPYAHPVFIVVVVGMVGILLLISLEAKFTQDMWIFGSYLLTLLLIYPHSLMPYSVSLIPLTLWLIQQGARAGVWKIELYVLVPLVLTIVTYDKGKYTYVVYLLYWCIFVGVPLMSTINHQLVNRYGHKGKIPSAG